jgi:hypothetical protein
MIPPQAKKRCAVCEEGAGIIPPKSWSIFQPIPLQDMLVVEFVAVTIWDDRDGKAN